MIHRLARQSFQGRTQRITCFLPDTSKFAELLEVDYVHGRITGRIIYDCYPGLETLEQSVQLRRSLLF